MKHIIPALIFGVMSCSAAAQETNNLELIKRGEYLARMGDCVACHTSKGGTPFAGGLPMATPIGTIYSTNITPDKETGIGDYSFEDFDKAVRQGIAKNGQTLYPAMPYPSYAVVTEDDMRALYAYFIQGVPAIKQENKETEIIWPLSMRWPLSIWRGLFAPDVVSPIKTPESIGNEDAILARGRYLVEGLGHCGACHTPRSITMQEKALNESEGSEFLSGSDAPIDGWIATNLRGDKRTGLGSWSEKELTDFLRTGRNDRTAVFGGMTDVVEHSLQYLTPEDATAIARYLKSLPAKDPTEQTFETDETVAKALWKGDDSKKGAALYVDNCAACHRTDGSGYTRFFPELKGNPTLLSDDATSLIHIVLTGDTLPGVKGAPTSITMPPFGWRLNDQQVTDVVNFIRTSWGNNAPEISAADVKDVRDNEEIIPDSKLLGSEDVSKLIVK